MQLLAAPFSTYSVRYFSECGPSAALSQQLAIVGEEFSKNNNVLDVAIGFTELVVSYNNIPPHRGRMPINLPTINSQNDGAQHIISVNYNGEDLNAIANHCHVSTTEAITLHSGSEYTVAMIGFKPHFPYLHGLNTKLHLARRASPRQKVKAGAVAIAAGHAGIYPSDTPGGWHIVGYCDPALCKALKAGDKVTFQDKGCQDKNSNGGN